MTKQTPAVAETPIYTLNYKWGSFRPNRDLSVERGHPAIWAAWGRHDARCQI